MTSPPSLRSGVPSSSGGEFRSAEISILHWWAFPRLGQEIEPLDQVFKTCTVYDELKSKEKNMPLYMDTHDRIERLEAEAAPAFEAPTETHEKYGARYLRCWFDGALGKVFCIIEAPSKEAAIAVHREAHGLIADKIVEVRLPSSQDYGVIALALGRRAPTARNAYLNASHGDSSTLLSNESASR